jgi:outer membrane protein OmpA-like peptidoglycan-associated protein
MATVRMQADRVHKTFTEVEGNTMGLGLGNLVSLRPRLDGDKSQPFWHEEDWEKQYLVIGAAYAITIDQYETGEVAKKDEPFKAKYRLLDSHVPFCSQRSARKPQMPGRQTALVVGPAGEEIWTDKFGRVMVQFDWDRVGQRNQKSSRWVRVSQAWSGGLWGAQYLPRVGQEVIVSYLEGDPDRPIITGTLYNKDNMPPYLLPANKTQSGIKSRSSKGGTAENFNEMRFEDKKGQEELHMQAEKDMSTLVKHDQTLRVGANRGIEVGKDETTQVQANRSTWVEANDSEVIGGTHDKTVTGAVTQIYGNDHSRKVDGEQELFAEKNKEEHVRQAHKLTVGQKVRLNQGPTNLTFEGGNVTVDSAGTITLRAGGATICFAKTGQATFDSPTGIKFECGASSLIILSGGVVLASPNVTAAAGAASLLMLGKETAGTSSKTVTIEAAGVCSIKGTSALKLQEAETKKSEGPKSPKLPKEETDKAKGRTPAFAARKGQAASSADQNAANEQKDEVTADRVRLVGMFFDLDKCFLLPSAMRGIREIKKQYDAHPDASLLLVGHTDTSGKDDYNLTLSLERAKAVAAYLTDDLAAWDAFFADGKPAERRWGLLEVQDMLTALPEGSTPYFGGTPNGADSQASRAAIKAFQHDKGLKEDGIAGPITRKALIKGYMGLDGTTLPKGTTLTTHGCGENFPVNAIDDGVRSADDRRVEIFFFDGPITPPPPGSTSPKGSTAYPSWLKRVTNTIDVGIGQAAGKTVRIMPVFEHDYRYTLRVGDRVYDGERTANQEIKHEVPNEATAGELTIVDKVDKVRYRWTVNLVTIEDLGTTLGMQQRLINLGYLSGEATGTEDDETRQALRDFQIDSDIDPSGKYDAATQDALHRKCSPN